MTADAKRLERLAIEEPRKVAMLAEFDGAIKYGPMLNDHPDWTNEQCIAFARKWHAIAIERLRDGEAQWNEGIPYCRNEPTDAMLREASK